MLFLNVKASVKKAEDKARYSLSEGYSPEWVRFSYEVGWSEKVGRGHARFSLGRQRWKIPRESIEEMRRDLETSRGNKDFERKFRPAAKKEPMKEGIMIGGNGRLFDLENIICLEANDLGGPTWDHPIVQEAIRESGYDIMKAANKLQLYFDNKVWLAIAPFIYVKKDDGKRAKMLPQNAGSSQVPIRPEDYGFALSQPARRLLSEIGRNDRIAFVSELQDELAAKGVPVNWDDANAVMDFLNAFLVNAYFYYAKEKRNEIKQDVLSGRLDAALEKAMKMDISQDRGNALCWIIMAHLNHGDAENAEAILKKMAGQSYGMDRHYFDYPSFVKASALVAMYYNKAGEKKDAERCFEPAEKMLENGFGAELLIKWQVIAGLEDRAIQTLLRFAHDYDRQDRLFRAISEAKPFEIDPADFETR